MLKTEDIHIKEVPVESEDIANQNGRKFVASVQRVWVSALSEVIVGTPFEDKAEAEMCVELNNQAMADIYGDIIRGFGEVVRVAKAEGGEYLPEKLKEAIENHHDQLETLMIMTRR